MLLSMPLVHSFERAQNLGLNRDEEVTTARRRPLTVCGSPAAATSISNQENTVAAVWCSHLLCRTFVIGEHFIDYSAGSFGFDAVGLCVFAKRNQAFPQRPTATSRPSCIVDGKSCAERVSAFTREERPCNRQVACGIAHTRTPEVDYCTHIAPSDQQVRCTNISVEPDGWTLPRCLESRFPHRYHCVCIDCLVQ